MSGFGGQKNAPWAGRGQQGGSPLNQPGMLGFGGQPGPVFQGGPPGVHPGLAGLGPMGGHTPVTSLASAVGQQVCFLVALPSPPNADNRLLNVRLKLN
jgi:hypothetical protein